MARSLSLGMCAPPRAKFWVWELWPGCQGLCSCDFGTGLIDLRTSRAPDQTACFLHFKTHNLNFSIFSLSALSLLWSPLICFHRAHHLISYMTTLKIAMFTCNLFTRELKCTLITPGHFQSHNHHRTVLETQNSPPPAKFWVHLISFWLLNYLKPNIKKPSGKATAFRNQSPCFMENVCRWPPKGIL